MCFLYANIFMRSCLYLKHEPIYHCVTLHIIRSEHPMLIESTTNATKFCSPHNIRKLEALNLVLRTRIFLCYVVFTKT